MKQSGIIIIFLILLLLLLGAGSYISYQAGKKSAIPFDTTITQKFDTTIHYITDHNYIKYIVLEKPPILSKEDSSLVAYNYFAVNVIIDSIADSLLVAWITDTITKNDLRSRSFSYKLLRPYESCTDYVYFNSPRYVKENSPFKLFASGFLEVDKNISGGIMLNGLSRKESLYGIGYDPFKKRVIISYGLKIHW